MLLSLSLSLPLTPELLRASSQRHAEPSLSQRKDLPQKRWPTILPGNASSTLSREDRGAHVALGTPT